MANNWAIVIGINQYRFLQPLRYAKRDAEAISEFLSQEAGFDRIFLFTDDSPEVEGKPTEPFRANLLRVLRQIFSKPFMKDGDNFWFFFSGHGIRHTEQDYLMPLDGDPEDVENTGIPTQLISNYLRSCGADNVVMILDACRSGGKKSGQGIGKQTEEEARQTGVISIFSCSPYEYSYELESIQQGAFTYTLIEGLGIRGRCATVERLNQYLQNQVPQLVQQLGRVRQTPYTIAEPLNRSHLILMPQHATLADIATLKNDAYNAEIAKNWELARRLWLRVLVAASGHDMDAVNAIERIGQERSGRSQPAVPPSPNPTLSNPSAQPTYSPISPRSVIPSNPLPPRNANPISSRLLHLTSQPSPSRQLTRQQFLKWGIPAGVGILGVTIAGRFLGNSFHQPLPSESQKPTPDPEPTVSASNSSPSYVTTENSSLVVDYSKLEEFLKAGQWEKADQETADLMLKIANQEQEGKLNAKNIENFPCDVLGKIDQLWVDNSQKKFGFSIQKKIYMEDCGGNPDGQHAEETWQCFANTVGWRASGLWVPYTELTFDISAKQGHFPYFDSLFRCWDCSMFRWGGAGWVSLLVQRLISCNTQ